MVAYAGQAILHASLAALIAEGLLRVWRVHDPGERLALRWFTLLSPFLGSVFSLAAPFRSSDAFGSTWALFAGTHWDELRVGGVGLATFSTCILSAAGLLLYLRDAVPFLDDRIRRRTQDARAPVTHPGWERIGRALAVSGRAFEQNDPSIRLLESATPVLLCTGVNPPRIVVSTGTLDRLDDEELRAALAHEVAHLVRRDPLLGWTLMLVRTLLAFNPAAQIVARQAVQEIESRADLDVARLGDSRALARAITRLAADRGSQTDLLPPKRRPRLHARVAERARQRAVGDRCQQVLEQQGPPGSALGRLRCGLAWAGISAILFFVV